MDDAAAKAGSGRADDSDEPPGIGIRRWGDACFHAVDEEVPEGYIIRGVLISREDVIEVRAIEPGEVCRKPVKVFRPPTDGAEPS